MNGNTEFTDPTMKMTRLAGPRRGVQRYIGPIDEEELGVQVRCRKIPSEEWQKAHPPGVPCEPPGDEDMVVQVVVLGSYGYPSRLKHPANWDRGYFPLVELCTTPYLQFRGAGDQDIARQKGTEPGEATDADKEVAEDEPPKETA